MCVVLYATDNFNLVLELAFRISAVELWFNSKLIQKSFIKPPWCQFWIWQVKKYISVFGKWFYKTSNQGRFSTACICCYYSKQLNDQTPPFHIRWRKEHLPAFVMNSPSDVWVLLKILRIRVLLAACLPVFLVWAHSIRLSEVALPIRAFHDTQYVVASFQGMTTDWADGIFTWSKWSHDLQGRCHWDLFCYTLMTV